LDTGAAGRTAEGISGFGLGFGLGFDLDLDETEEVFFIFLGFFFDGTDEIDETVIVLGGFGFGLVDGADVSPLGLL